MFSPQGPSLRELTVQALSSVERGYDLLAPKFDHTPFRTPVSILDATTAALAARGPFAAGLDVCCGTGAGLGVLESVVDGRVAGVDFSAGMLDQARRAHPGAELRRGDVRKLEFDAEFDLAVTFGALGHFLPAERPAVFAGVYRALRPGGLFAFPINEPPSVASVAHWVMLGFDTVMRVRNFVWRPPFVMYYRITGVAALTADLAAAGFTVGTEPLPALGNLASGGPRFRMVLARK
ncbi:class I SAM-dependent methyltransferase [Actinoplanes bogorensis]|uniref:Class I SAM-dependent methyltransferase n=1 Tax=Paractinoplanes bogorensis TaxID=1610840 RepID=A0ABS5YRX0_9ACTN|nr:class I SAM-dependent methyltransferase [Actinoplanes bogorensis]MBU2666200.1 class I SAM-dependent methyltransferase [Actinoplanes bogorensis]